MSTVALSAEIKRMRRQLEDVREEIRAVEFPPRVLYRERDELLALIGFAEHVVRCAEAVDGAGDADGDGVGGVDADPAEDASSSRPARRHDRLGGQPVGGREGAPSR